MHRSIRVTHGIRGQSWSRRIRSAIASLCFLGCSMAPLFVPTGPSAAAERPSPTSPTGFPSAATCTIPAGITLVGLKDGVADPAGLFTVTVRDLSNNPIASVPVDIDLSGQPDVFISTSQPFAGVTATSCSVARAFTNGAGIATFTLVGNASGRFAYPAPSAVGASIRAAGVLIGNCKVAAYDLDGANGLDAADLSLWSDDLSTALNLGRSDYDYSGSVGANDLSLLQAALAAGNSVTSGTGCVVVPVPDQPFTGGLSLGWTDCRGGASSLIDQFWACNLNTGVPFDLVGGLQPTTPVPDARAFEAIVDVVSLSGPLPDWWRFEQPAGCRRTSLSNIDPANNASLTCALPTTPSLTGVSAVYPFAGDAAVERLLITGTYQDPVPLGPNETTPIFNLRLTRSKTTGVGSCAGCATPVRLVLRSIRIVRGDPLLPPADRPPAVVFTQTGGSAVRWQSNTPTSNITIDATALGGAQQFQLNGGTCLSTASPQVVSLAEGSNVFRVCTSTCPSMGSMPISFEVDAAGNVTYAPELEGALTGAGTTTLVVHSVTFPPPGDDLTSSLGVFRVIVEPQFWDMMNGYPGFQVVNGLHRLVSPPVYDPLTVIGRSTQITHGSVQDQGGVLVGSAGSVVADTSFSVVPPDFQGPAGTPEIHTEIHDMNMVDWQTGLVRVRAGLHAPDQRRSPGEIEALPGATGLFPAESFFNVFVEVDLPNLEGLFSNTTLYNTDPLMVENSGVSCFPPRVVYQHRHTGPVQMRFKANDTHVPARWAAGDVFGWLVLAGHGINWDTVTTVPAHGRAGAQRILSDPVAEFLAIANAEPEMADTATLVVDVHDAVTFAPAGDFGVPQFRDSLNLGIDHAAGLGKAGNPCAGLFEAMRLYQRVDSLASPPDWVTAPGLRRVLANRLIALMNQLQAQANQTGGCPGVLDAPPSTPRNVALLGIHPNPSSGNATIRYALPSRGRVSLMIYDVSGRHVRTLVDSELPAGTFQAIWDGHQDRANGRMAKSGTYFVRLSAMGRTETRRLVIVH